MEKRDNTKADARAELKKAIGEKYAAKKSKYERCGGKVEESREEQLTYRRKQPCPLKKGRLFSFIRWNFLFQIMHFKSKTFNNVMITIMDKNQAIKGLL